MKSFLIMGSVSAGVHSGGKHAQYFRERYFIERRDAQALKGWTGDVKVT